MSNPILPVEFENMILNISNVPEPDIVFQDSLRERFIAKGVSYSKETSRSRLGKRQIPSTLKWALVIALIVALTLIATSPTVVAALKKLLGYIPGLGIVEQNTPFHILVEPISQMRDGVTITVEKAIMNEDNILLTHKVEGLTPDKFSFLEPLNTCMSVDELHFPNGEVAKPDAGISSMSLDNGYETTNRYSPVPIGTRDAILFIPCINGALSPGILPENWELTLRFDPAPPDVALTMMPVIEVTMPNLTVMPSDEIAPPPTPDAGIVNPLTITKFIDAGDNSPLYGESYRHSYILFGELNPPAPSQPGEWRIDWVSLDLVDNNGQVIFWRFPNDIDQPVSDSPHKLVWAILIPEFAPPLRVTQTARYAISSVSQETFVFEFDAGANPQSLQEWNMNAEFQFAGRAIRLTKILANPVRTGYIFSFETDDSSVNSLSAKIDGYPSIKHLLLPILLPGKSGSTWDFYEYYSATLPSGKLKVILSDLYLNGETKDWTLDWLP